MDFPKGKRLPEMMLDLADGSSVQLSSFQQRENVVLVVGVTVQAESSWEHRLEESARLWEWLRVKPLLVEKASALKTSSIYLIDRLGVLVDVLPIEPWDPSSIEKAYVYHEARHC